MPTDATSLHDSAASESIKEATYSNETCTARDGVRIPSKSATKDRQSPQRKTVKVYSLCVRDLRIYAQANDGEVFHYRDRYELEADAIVHLKDGRWGAVEVKLGSREIEEAAWNLLILKERVDLERMKEPSFLMVLTGGEIAYRRRDGVLIVPIGCLKD